MVLIRECQKPTGDTALLQDVKERKALRDGQAIVFGAVDNQLRCTKLIDMLRSRWIPATIVVSIIPESAVELKMSVGVSKHKRKLHTSCCMNQSSSVDILASATKVPSWQTSALNLRPRGLPWIQLIIKPPKLAPAATPLSVSMKSKLSRTYSQHFTRSS